MSEQSELMRYDPIIEISKVEDDDLRAYSLELWDHAKSLASGTEESQRYLPATIIQIADHFNDEQELAKTALSAVSVFVAEGEIGLEGNLDKSDLDSIEDIITVMKKVGLKDADVQSLVEVFHINMSLGVLEGLRNLTEELEDMSASDIKSIRRELGLDADRDEYEEDDYDDHEDHDEEQIEVTEVDAETIEIDTTDKELSVERLQKLLGRIGLIGVDVIKMADMFDLSPEDPDFIEELSYVLENVAKDKLELEELLFKTDASARHLAPQDILGALADYHAAAMYAEEPEHEPFDNESGTISTDVDESGEEFII